METHVRKIASPPVQDFTQLSDGGEFNNITQETVKAKLLLARTIKESGLLTS